MTTTVTVEAHCGNEKEVHIEIKENGDSTKVLQNGDKHVLHVYGNKRTSIHGKSNKAKRRKDKVLLNKEYD